MQEGRRGVADERKGQIERVFLEEDLIHSMLLIDQGIFYSPIGGFEYGLVLDQMVDPLGRCNEEANIILGLILQVHSPPHTSMREMDYGEPTNSGPTYPPSFKDYLGVGGHSNWTQVQCMSNENIWCKNSLEDGNEADQSYKESYCSISNSVEKFPKSEIVVWMKWTSRMRRFHRKYERFWGFRLVMKKL